MPVAERGSTSKSLSGPLSPYSPTAYWGRSNTYHPVVLAQAWPRSVLCVGDRGFLPVGVLSNRDDHRATSSSMVHSNRITVKRTSESKVQDSRLRRRRAKRLCTYLQESGLACTATTLALVEEGRGEYLKILRLRSS